MALAFTLWAAAWTMVVLATSAMIFLVVARIVRGRADSHRARLKIRLRSSLTRAVAGEEITPLVVAELRRHPVMAATLLLEIGGLIRGADRDQLFGTLEANGVFGALCIIAGRPRHAGQLICVEAVALFPVAEAARVLRALWRDPDPAIRLAAAGGLIARDDVTSVSLMFRDLLSPSEAPSGHALDIIGRLSRLHPTTALREARRPNLPPPVLAAIFQAIGDAGDYGLIDDLAAWADHADSSVRAAAIEALGSMRHPSVQPLVTVALDDQSWQVRSAAIRATGLGGFETGVERLAERLADPQWNLRFAAARALGQMEGAGVARLREAAHQDHDPRVREIARAIIAERETA